jgi:hypothetical protein
MRENTHLWLRALVAGLFLLLLAGAAGSALTVIHLREEAAGLASNTSRLRATAGETTRLLQEMGAAVAAAQDPAVLRARIGNRLVQISQQQIVWVINSGSTTPVEAPAPAPAPPLSFRVAALEPEAPSSILR